MRKLRTTVWLAAAIAGSLGASGQSLAQAPIPELPQFAGAQQRLDASAPAVAGAAAAPMYSYTVKNAGELASSQGQAAQDLRRQAQTMYVAFYYANAQELKSRQQVGGDYIRKQASEFESRRAETEAKGEQPYVPMRSRFEAAQARTLDFLQGHAGDIKDGQITVSMDHYRLPNDDGKMSDRLGMKTEYTYTGQDGKDHQVEVYRYAIPQGMLGIPTPVSMLVVDGKPVVGEDGTPKLYRSDDQGAKDFTKDFEKTTGGSKNKKQEEQPSERKEEKEPPPDADK